MSKSNRLTPEVSDELYSWLSNEAERQHRTLHSLVVHILEIARERRVPVIGRDTVVGIQKHRAGQDPE